MDSNEDSQPDLPRTQHPRVTDDLPQQGRQGPAVYEMLRTTAEIVRSLSTVEEYIEADRERERQFLNRCLGTLTNTRNLLLFAKSTMTQLANDMEGLYDGVEVMTKEVEEAMCRIQPPRQQQAQPEPQTQPDPPRRRHRAKTPVLDIQQEEQPPQQQRVVRPRRNPPVAVPPFVLDSR
jgi:DNA segregation ATPase FtsK/SpoIIIE-like protein